MDLEHHVSRHAPAPSADRRRRTARRRSRHGAGARRRRRRRCWCCARSTRRKSPASRWTPSSTSRATAIRLPRRRRFAPEPTAGARARRVPRASAAGQSGGPDSGDGVAQRRHARRLDLLRPAARAGRRGRPRAAHLSRRQRHDDQRRRGRAPGRRRSSAKSRAACASRSPSSSRRSSPPSRISPGSSTPPGADGLVLFTRFHRVDIDVEELEVVRTLPLSDSSELPMRLRGAAAAVRARSTRPSPSPAASTPASTSSRPPWPARTPRRWCRRCCVTARSISAPSARDIETWMQEHEWSSLSDMRGNMSLERIPDPAAYERANFRMALR